MRRRLLLLALALWGGEALAGATWREDFRSKLHGWEVRTKPGVDPTHYRTDAAGADGTGVLIAEADDASATFATQLDGVDLTRTPILRWRWRVLEYPRGADGRDAARDDQPIAIYVSYGGVLRQRSIAYRWETDTPVGTEGDATYAAGVVKVHWIVVRNSQDGVGVFHVEQRDVAADFRRVFGFVPKDPIVAVASNSQYTRTQAKAELDWIELAPLAELRGR